MYNVIGTFASGGDIGYFNLLSLHCRAFQFFMEVLGGILNRMKDCHGFSKAFSAQSASLTSGEDASAVLDRARLDEYRRVDGDDRAAQTALDSKMEYTAPVSRPSLWDSTSKLCILARAVNGIPWALHTSFLLPALLTYYDLVDSLLHALRTLKTDVGRDSQPLLNPPVSMNTCKWYKQNPRENTLLADTLENEEYAALFSAQRRCGGDSVHVRGDSEGLSAPLRARGQDRAGHPITAVVIFEIRGALLKPVPSHATASVQSETSRTGGRQRERRSCPTPSSSRTCRH